MSMPSYPKHGADMTREQALTMVVASIAQEESALSRIIDAEGKKLEAVIKRLEEDADLCCLLEANRSVTRLLDVVMQNQLLLRGKLALALDSGGCPPPQCPPPCPPGRPECPPPPPSPCPPPRPPREKCAAQLTGPGCEGFLWRSGCQLPWSCCFRQGNGIRWREDCPALVELDASRGYAVTCQINLRDFLPVETGGRICLETGEAFPKQPPLAFSLRCAGGEAATLQYSALLLPCGGKRGELSLRLCARGVLCVSEAVLNIVEL